MTAREYFEKHESPTWSWHSSFPPGKTTSWEEFHQRVDELGKINFGCDFQDGKCKSQRKHQRLADWTSNPMSCCKGCAGNFGYLNYIQPGTTDQYVSLYDKTTGFWRENQGCILPRKMRSATCLSYACGSIVRGLPDTYGIMSGKLVQIGVSS